MTNINLKLKMDCFKHRKTYMIAWKHFSSSFEKRSSINVRFVSTSCQNNNKKALNFKFSGNKLIDNSSYHNG